MSIIETAAAVFIGNMATIIVYICLKQFDVPAEEFKNVPTRYLLGFLVIVALVCLAVIGQGASM